LANLTLGTALDNLIEIGESFSADKENQKCSSAMPVGSPAAELGKLERKAWLIASRFSFPWCSILIPSKPLAKILRQKTDGATVCWPRPAEDLSRN